jgi:16S rRNA (guanine527-N7)-methyltransferase
MSFEKTLIDNVVWQTFISEYQLTATQIRYYARYIELLIEWNERINLTAITKVESIITDHMIDSLAASPLIEKYTRYHLADVGAGAGFPSIPLLIKYPQSSAVLIEINGKKRAFLAAVVKELELGERVIICDIDWRTFIRSTHYTVDLFVARASLRPDELIRVLRMPNHYRQALIAYWASAHWQSEMQELPYLKEEFAYTCADKQRRIIVFGV